MAKKKNEPARTRDPDSCHSLQLINGDATGAKRNARTGLYYTILHCTRKSIERWRGSGTTESFAKAKPGLLGWS